MNIGHFIKSISRNMWQSAVAPRPFADSVLKTPNQAVTVSELKAAFGTCYCKQCTYVKQSPPKPTKKPLRRFIFVGIGAYSFPIKAINRSDARATLKKKTGLKSTAKLELEELKR